MSRSSGLGVDKRDRRNGEGEGGWVGGARKCCRRIGGWATGRGAFVPDSFPGGACLRAASLSYTSTPSLSLPRLARLIPALTTGATASQPAVGLQAGVQPIQPRAAAGDPQQPTAGERAVQVWARLLGGGRQRPNGSNRGAAWGGGRDTRTMDADGGEGWKRTRGRRGGKASLEGLLRRARRQGRSCGDMGGLFLWNEPSGCNPAQSCPVQIQPRPE